MNRFTIEDLRKLKRAMKAQLPKEARLIEKIETALELQIIRREAKRRRRAMAE